MADMCCPGYCSFFVLDRPGAYRKVYVAKILGDDPQYVFERQFVDLHAKDKDGGRLYWFELDEYGLYEFGLKWYRDGSKKGDAPLSCSRTRFVVMDGAIDHYVYRTSSVLPELEKLKRYIRIQEAADPGGDAA